ncbi:MAG: toll/interleukin-1 receptor domain-containing protein [Candidatus Nitrotoga sp.]
MKIFFSYPHDDNAPLVERIKTGLEVRGHEVWFDADQIKSGELITRGILDSQQVITVAGCASIAANTYELFLSIIG